MLAAVANPDTERASPHPSLLTRKIIHFDMDAFYAAIEIRDDPSLRGKPVIVGGSPQSRGVVCTASYEARRYGIHSAMPCSHAFRLCPHAIFLRPNFEKYSAAAQAIRAIFRRYTSQLEPLSLDEAYLDVTNNPQGLFAVKIARLIQQEVFETLRLTGSAGVAPNKLLAKIASDMRKPNGLTVVLPAQARTFMAPLPLRKIHGIGPVTEKHLTASGLVHCRDVWRLSPSELANKVGNMAAWLYERSQGLDTRPVQTDWLRKSLSREATFPKDILDVATLKAELAEVAHDVAADLHEEELAGRTIVLKLRYNDFQRITRSHTLPIPTADEATIRDEACRLLETTEAGRRKVRLVGVAVTNFR